MCFEIKNKVALITGGAAGIGFNVCKELLRNGAKGVTLADINAKNGLKALDELQNEFGRDRVIFVRTDVTDIQSYKSAFQETINTFSNIDILINNAGILDDRIWEKAIDVNIKGTIYGMILGLEDYLQKYRSTPEGVIVNMSSTAGIEAFKEIPIYTATKFAICGLSRAWGHEMHYQRTKIKVLTVCPNATDTQMSKQLNEKCLRSEYGKSMLKVIDELPNQTPESVAKGVVEIIRIAKPGSGWLIEDGKDPYEFPVTVKDSLVQRFCST